MQSMKILVVSDTHGEIFDFKDVVEYEKPDRIYHLGDGEGIEEAVWKFTDIPMEIVCGNCDWGSDLPSNVVLEVGKHVIFLTHGHMYQVRSGYDNIARAAAEKGCDTVLYGHTHVPGIDYISTENGPMTIANPGSLAYPRQASREHTYMIIEVDAAGEFKMFLHSVEEMHRAIVDSYRKGEKY